VTEGMGGTGHDMGCDGGWKGGRGGKGRREGHSPQTSIPGAATAIWAQVGGGQGHKLSTKIDGTNADRSGRYDFHRWTYLVPIIPR